MHHDLEIKPIPENVLYVNDPFMGTIAEPYEKINEHEMAKTGKTKEEGGILPDDNVRIYVPLDLNRSQIMQELCLLYGMLGSPGYSNEVNLAILTEKVIQKLEIYDQVWVARDAENAVQMKNGIYHSKQGIALAQEIIDFMEEDAEFLEEDEAQADTSPYEIIDRLKDEWGL